MFLVKNWRGGGWGDESEVDLCVWGGGGGGC